jgi:glycosyltransferase involved in cell wall biosynthesis
VKVAMVAACPFPANHGTAGNIREMSEMLARRGHEVHVITYPMRQAIPVAGVSIHRVGNMLRSRPVLVGPTPSKPLLDLLMVGALVRCIRREGLELIHAHNYEGALIGFLAQRVVRRPLLYHAHNTMADELPSYGFIRPKALAVGLARLLDAFVPRTGDEVIVLSEELRAFVAARGVSPARTTLVPIGVHPEMFEGKDRMEFRRRLGVGDGPLVAYTGTLDRFQRVDYLIQAMARVAARVPDARLALGANMAKEEDAGLILAQARELGIANRVVIVHPLSLEELPAFLAAADVVVCPRPACPGFPVKVLNYMAARKPIVTARGSAKGLRHLETAFVADDHDWQGLAAGIVTLLEDDVLAKRLAEEAGAAIIGTFDWPSLAERIEGVYERMLGR